ncbi:sulfurtransferase TusA family protein [Natranaerobius thermophilus]|uniref:Ferredoxin--nitrite reductase n=1 Tax=Natranaerobius thermophilus (strain ATCC BAA-1301 / DSM 18059 / JW/NM-WN-LF) TaxID=457570 RepID=B2A155_NATTJ|nr:sulfurtransferase TusA family protein [Natranaerobius thermophilus]ACB84678.1 Ferredoxin--nitrite reductase [Natranaerobius thermophilus JW/NM-WN-LF]
MQLNVPEEIIRDLKSYQDKVMDFQKGDLDEFRFKPYRVGRGVYEQRNGKYMIRTRLPGGELTLEQLKVIKKLAEAYAENLIHLTTRQDIQFHNVELSDSPKIIEELLQWGILTKGSGGNTPRNVVGSPLSGVSKDEVFDIRPFVKYTTDYLLQDESAFNLPRKFKIAFSNSLADTANATISDLGFIAKIKDGQKGFEVYGAGGLGNEPSKAIKLFNFITEDQILFHVETMKELFQQKGDRLNKNKARIRHIMSRLGQDQFKELYYKLLKQIKADHPELSLWDKISNHLDINDENKDSFDNFQIDSQGQAYRENRYSEISNQRKIQRLSIEQKQAGAYSVYFHPEKGDLNTRDLQLLITTIEQMNDNISFRISNTQGFYLCNLSFSEGELLINKLDYLIPEYQVECSVSCPGAATCKLGLCLSQKMLIQTLDELKQSDTEALKELPRLYISGCPNSCGQHQIGLLGLSGKASRTEDGLVPAYTVYMGGKTEANKGRLATEFGEIPAQKVPVFLKELAKLKAQNGYKDFEEFVYNSNKKITQLITVFSTLESYQENPGLYFDFGSNKQFSLEGRGPGECGAGVLDIIKIDINNAESRLQDYQNLVDTRLLYQAALSGARALLVLKGIDTNKDREIFNEFIKHFVDTGYVRDSVIDLVNNLMDFKMGDLSDLSSYYDEVIYLVQRVKEIFQSLNSRLEITAAKVANESEQQTQKSTNSGEESQGEESDVVDLRGVKCPMNFVKVKMALSSLQNGEIQAFYLDNGEPMDNVPQSVRDEGHFIKDIVKYSDYSKILIKKSD